MGTCSVDGCEKPKRTNGLCPMHASRMRRHGKTDQIRYAHGTAEDRFWRKVEKAGPDDCWQWIGGGHQVYGSFMTGGRGSPRKLAHRFSYEIHCGPIAEGMLVLHSCDNPLCVNPAHLRQGTPKDNMLDKISRGRDRNGDPRGEGNGNAVLNEHLVRLIRASPLPTKQLADVLGLNDCTVRDVRKGRRWTHVT